MATIDVEVNTGPQVVKIMRKMLGFTKKKTNRKQSSKAIISQLVVHGMYISYQKFVKKPRNIHI